MKTKTIKIISLILAILATVIVLPSCDTDISNATKISFKSAASYEQLKELDGKTVTINGYIATSSPVDGSFIFLMNLPYQNCPFCVPNTNELSNTMEVYPRNGDKFKYTAQAVKIIGKLVVAPNRDKPFKDKYGYEFVFKIVDAQCIELNSDEMSKEMALWQEIAQADIIPEIYRMYDYVNFVCKWNTYKVDSYYNDKGEYIKGFYLNNVDAENFLKKNGAQFNYGYKEGYFDGIRNSIKNIDANAFCDLIANIDKAEALSKKAIEELKNGEFTYELKDLEEFDTKDYVYTLNKGEELKKEYNEVFNEFAIWLSGWEM